ncbi:HOOK protein-domain-containing protein, partial [Radiomyces spectabilis]|uniref:HOOK protein-domain-containing protein n=1 Tax=Radiomyces spectabilis TaxID=64574 RepID=UPI00222111FA
SPERRVSRIQQETRELDLAHQQLIKQHEELKQRYDDLELEKEELHIHLREIDHAIQLANEAGKADFAMRTEIDRIRQDLQHSEDRRQEIESILENQLETIHHLTQKTESLAEQAEYAERLKDQLDEVHHAAEKLQKAEGTIDKYRKKLQETTELRRHIKALEEQNGSLVDRNHHIEEEYRKVFVFKTLMDSYKDQVTSLEAKNSELIRETQFVEYQSQQLHQKLETLEEDRTRDADRIQSLEDHLEDLRGTSKRGCNILTDDDEKDTMSEDEEDDQCYDEATQFEHTVKEKNTMASLKDQVKFLQIRSLQKNNLSKGQERITALHQLLQETNLQKTEFEKHYLDAAQERDILQSLMMRVRAGIPEALLDRSEATKPDRDRIDALQLELKTLRETVHEMQTNPPSTLLQKNDTDALKYLEELKQKINGLEEQSKHQLQDINKLLLEKDWLYSQNMERKDLLLEKECFNSEMRASLAAMNAKDDMALRQQNTQLQQTTKELEQHMEELNIKLRKAKEFIKQQDRMLKDIKFGQHSTSHKMSAASLQAAIKQREEENDRLKMQLRESRVQARREQQLLLCAWQDVARRAHRTLIHSRLYPSAWFGAQSRKRPDSYPKR